MNNKLLFFFITILAIFLTRLPVSGMESYGDYKIQPGDVLKITVMGEDDLFRELQVSADGKINYPLLGEVDVKEKTASALSVYITTLLNEYLVDPHVTVFISGFGKIFVFGEVIKPGAFELTKTISLLESLTLAGGLTQHANQKKIKILRKTGKKEKAVLIDLTGITQKDTPDEDIPLHPGDVVIVPESFL